MSKVYGDLSLVNGRVLNLKIESLEEIPEFTEDDSGRIIFLSEDKTLKVNTGDEWLTIQFSNSSADPLLDMLGRNWINPDISFNPTPFNDLENINGLTADDTLFSVIAKIDEAISSVQQVEFSELEGVEFSNLQVGNVLFYNGTNFTNVSLNDLANTVVELPTNKLSDVVVTSYNAGDILIRSESLQKFVNRKIFYEYINLAAATNFTINHMLANKYCSVQVINALTDIAINDYTVKYMTANQILLTLPTSTPVRVLVWTFNKS